MSFMPSIGAKVILTNGKHATIVRVTPDGSDDRVRLDDGSERRITVHDVVEVTHDKEDDHV